MQKKNLIYIVGGAAVIGYFLWMKKKNAAELPSQASETTPDQALAPAFVNETTDVIKKVANTVKSLRKKGIIKRRGAQTIDENSGMVAPTSQGIEMPNMPSEAILSPSSPLSEIMSDMSPATKKSILSPRAAKKEVRASGGSAKQARQAAKAARKSRKMGELSVTF